MKSSCQRCGDEMGGGSGRACLHGCTFCATCAEAMNGRCPNCGGALDAAVEVA